MDGVRIKELCGIIPNLPGVRVYLFAQEAAEAQALSQFCAQAGHYLEIAALQDEIYKKLEGIDAKIRRIDEHKERYNQRSWLFDTIFVTYDLSKLDNQEEFFKKIYRMMKNAADLIVIIEPSQSEKLQEELQELNFVAINPIELGQKIAVTAKKMHGWTRV